MFFSVVNCKKHKTTESPSSQSEKRQFSPGKTQKPRVLRGSVVKMTFLQSIHLL